MSNSGTAPSDPQGQPEHAEYHRVSYPYRCHWIVIMKVIVQGTIIPDILVTEPDQIQDHEARGTSATQWATSITDRLPFSGILQAVIEKHDTREYIMLAALCPCIVTAHDLLREVERLWAQARERSERDVEIGVFHFIR